MATAVVDILFTSDETPFYNEDVDIIKELAVVDIRSFASQQWRFAKPHQESPTFDNIGWGGSLSTGDVAYEKLEQILKSATDSYKVIFTYGVKECSILKTLLQRSTVFNLYDLFNVELCKLPLVTGTECLHHFHLDAASICPHANAYRLAVWCSDNSARTNMLTYKGRLKTFNKWSFDAVNEKTLASAGFFHIPSTDFPNLTECIYCGLQVFSWSEDDIPIVKHRHQSKYCMLFNYCTFSGVDF
jgi:Inhibitor of Apoptosis domain